MVHHSSYVVWMEEGRSEFMRQSGADYADVERGGHLFAVTSIQVRYLASAHYGERVTVRTWVQDSRQPTVDVRLRNRQRFNQRRVGDGDFGSISALTG